MFDSVSGRIDDLVRRWVHDLINGLYGFLHVIFAAVAKEWVGLNRAEQGFANSFYLFAHSVWVKFTGLLRIVVPRIVNEYRRLIAETLGYAQQVYRDLVSGLVFVEQYSRRLVDGAITWVRDNVYTPLLKSLTGAWQWITQRGETLWHYLTHPDMLAALLFDSLIALLEREAWAVADKLGRFALSLVARNLRQFAALVEDILNAIL